MSPVTPHWTQPSHPEIQEVIINEAAFTTKSLSRVTLPPFAVFAKLAFPPCTDAYEPTYATVQTGRSTHLNLNSDLLYINHSCEPTLIFDTGNMNVMTGPKGLKPGDELSFFYPSTEWNMAQPFDCLCGTATCRGIIDGARNMSAAQLSGMWLNNHIREMLDDQARGLPEDFVITDDPTAVLLRNALALAEKSVEASRQALRNYAVVQANGERHGGNAGAANLGFAGNGIGTKSNGFGRRGPTSRELSGEMSGDTIRV